MDNGRFFGLTMATLSGLTLFLLLVILGIVALHYNTYVTTTNGLRAGASFDVALLPQYAAQQQQLQGQRQGFRQP